MELESQYKLLHSSGYFKNLLVVPPVTIDIPWNKTQHSSTTRSFQNL